MSCKLKCSISHIILLCKCILIFSCIKLNAQFVPNRNSQFPINNNQLGQQSSKTNSKDDSLIHRTGLEDSITISFRYFDSTRSQKLDNSVNDFTKYFPIPAHYIYLGNVGNASRSLLFSPIIHPGWDAGFHAYDIYMSNIERTRFFNTTRPYTTLNYMIGSHAEQLINVLHTQNFNPNWNMAFDYHLISAPGWFKSQKTNHNNITISSFYQTRNKRYSLYAIYFFNKINGSENGGIINNSFLNDPRYKSRELIPTQLGGDATFSTNFFTSNVTTGAAYKTSTFLFRHQYDLGQKDSLKINDTTTVKLFYARIRFQHSFQYNTYEYSFIDQSIDSTSYHDNFQITIPSGSTITLKDKWQELINEFSILSYPDKKNQNQFLKLGVAIQNLKGSFSNNIENYINQLSNYNLYTLAEYRNKTRNQLWDIEANGKLYINGWNAGDYGGFISLNRFISKKIGSLTAGFENINRTPSFIFNPESSFLYNGPANLNKENISHIFGSIDNSYLQLKLTGDYYLIGNYTYFNDLYKATQQSSLLNVLRISASKTIQLNKHIFWYADVYAQQASNIKVVSLPLFFSRNRLAFEGIFFKNLNISTGLEIKYHTPYKAYGYSPINGQFYVQPNTIISNRPEGAAFVHFAIKSFRAYIRFENLNALDFQNSFSFTQNNMAAPLYPYPGLVFKLGIAWGFVN